MPRCVTNSELQELHDAAGIGEGYGWRKTARFIELVDPNKIQAIVSEVQRTRKLLKELSRPEEPKVAKRSCEGREPLLHHFESFNTGGHVYFRGTGEGPFVVLKTGYVPADERASVGHHQFITIMAEDYDGGAPEPMKFSGAWFTHHK